MLRSSPLALELTPQQYEWLATSPKKEEKPPFPVPSQREIFDHQLETLIRWGLIKFNDAQAFSDRLPEAGLFLLVPQQPRKIQLSTLMAYVVMEGKAGINRLDFNRLRELTKPTDAISLLIGIDDGRKRLNESPRASERGIRKIWRHPLNVWQGIVFAIAFPQVVLHHGIDLVGTLYGMNTTPGLTIDKTTGRLELIEVLDYLPDPGWGAPSAENILVP